MVLCMKNKFTDKELMAFADGELDNLHTSMDILSVLVDKKKGYEELGKRLKVYTTTRTALLNSLIGKTK